MERLAAATNLGRGLLKIIHVNRDVVVRRRPVAQPIAQDVRIDFQRGFGR